MARQSFTAQGSRAIGPAMAGIAFMSLTMDLQEKAAGALCRVVCAMVGQFVQALPCMLLATFQTLEFFGLDHSPMSLCMRLIMSVGPLLHFVVGVV